MPIIIEIEYDSSWRNSFLDGTNNQPLPQKGRNFVGSITTLKQQGTIQQRSITKDTVMGILNRLIGEQRKLYQARQDPNYYFQEIETLLTEEDIQDYPLVVSNELVFIRNITGSEDQNSFTGMVKATDPAFSSPFSNLLWGILFLDKSEVIDFILGKPVNIAEKVNELDPLIIVEQLELLNSLKPLEVDERLTSIIALFNSKFPDVEYLNKKQQLPAISLYTAALYLQIARLKTQFDLTHVLTKSGGLSGISKRGFTKKDFMARYTSGAKKRVWGNPFILKEKIKGVGEVTSMLQKATGRLEIYLNLPKEKAQDLQQKIENAGVSSFYLGKKGLAYVVDIKQREKIS
jgi:hypothetical protein